MFVLNTPSVKSLSILEPIYTHSSDINTVEWKCEVKYYVKQQFYKHSFFSYLKRWEQ